MMQGRRGSCSRWASKAAGEREQDPKSAAYGNQQPRSPTDTNPIAPSMIKSRMENPSADWPRPQATHLAGALSIRPIGCLRPGEEPPGTWMNEPAKQDYRSGERCKKQPSAPLLTSAGPAVFGNTARLAIPSLFAQAVTRSSRPTGFDTSGPGAQDDLPRSDKSSRRAPRIGTSDQLKPPGLSQAWPGPAVRPSRSARSIMLSATTTGWPSAMTSSANPADGLSRLEASSTRMIRVRPGVRPAAIP